MALFESLNAQSTPDQIAAAYNEYVGGAGGDTQANQAAATSYLTNLGVSAPTISQAYNTYLQPAQAPTQNFVNPLNNLGPVNNTGIAQSFDQSTAQIAPPVQNNVTGTGIATLPAVQTQVVTTPTATNSYFQANPDVAAAYAQNNYGMTPDQFAQAHYQNYGANEQRAAPTYTQDQVNQFAKEAAAQAGGTISYTDALNAAKKYGIPESQVAAALNTGVITGADQAIASHFANPADSTDSNAGLLSGFKYIHDQGIGDDVLRKTFGNATVDQYKQKFNDFTKTATDNIMADKNLSFDEAAAAVKFANDYGLNTKDLASMTGYKQGLFDTIKSGYDKGLSTIASKLDTDPTKAPADQVKNDIGGLLAAQQKYGITDRQLADASNGKYTASGIAQLLDPVRNVQKTITDLSSDPNASGDSVRQKLQDLTGNKYVSALYGDAISPLTAAANKTYSGTYGGKTAENMNPLAVNNVLNQLKAERDAAAKAGTNLINGGAASGSKGGFGSADAVLEDMAKNLVASGVTDIRQVGQKPVTEKQTVTEQYTYNGQPVQEVANDYGGGSSYYTISPDGNYVQVDKTQLQKQKGYTQTVGGGEDYTTKFVPLTPDQEKSIKDGKVDVPTGQNQIINKATGKPLASNYAERTSGNMWSGTFAGPGNTGYGVQFNKDGTPIFYTQGASSSDLGQIAPLLTMASFIPGVAPFAMAANAAIAASQGNWLGALASGIGALPGVGNAIGGAGTIASDTASTLGNVSKGLNVANAVNQGNWAGALAGAANLGGMGNTQIGDTGVNVSQAFKGLGVLGALNRGDYLSAGLGGADLAGVNTVPGTDFSLKNVMNAVNIGRAAQTFDKNGNPVPLINAVGQTVTRAKGGLLEGVSPDKVRASAQDMDPAYFRGIAANLRTA